MDLSTAASEEIDCNEEDIGETSSTLGARYREHLKEPSPIHAHSLQTGHNSTQDSFNIIRREDQALARTKKESIYTRVNNTTLSRNIGKFDLNHIWDIVLLNIPGLKINSSKGYVHMYNSGHVQLILTSRHLQISIGHSGHAVNSEHVLRTS